MLKTILIIGVHLEELPFGKLVAEGAGEMGIDVLRIKHGLSNDRHLHRDFYYYKMFHRELYSQIHRQIQGVYDLAIDLHSGINETGCCVDILCYDINFLDRLNAALKNKFQDGRRPPETIRLLQIVKDSTMFPERGGISYPVCRSFIPETVWRARHYLYVGLEIYLPHAGKGSPEDWLFARQMVKCIHDCGKNCE